MTSHEFDRHTLSGPGTQRQRTQRQQTQRQREHRDSDPARAGSGDWEATGPGDTESADTLPAEWLHRRLGATPLSNSRTRFCLWAPARSRIEVELVESGRFVELSPRDGFHQADVDGVPEGTLYRYRIDGGPSRPDPASRFQPQGVHGPSQVRGRDFPWGDSGWRGVPREAWVIYELHVGTFTEQGTFLAAIDRLDELVELGITVIELMPVAESSGRWNWGYDGVGWFAPSHTFGTPDDLRRLVDAAHAKGLAVFLDVVYNHIGPEGNYLGDYGGYLSRKHSTPWGAAPNFDHRRFGRGVGRFVIANAIHWYEEYHIDGLRIDAIHCMADDSDPHIVRRLGEAVHRWRDASGRPAALIAESNVYDPEMTGPLEEGGMGFDAQWCDDFLHSVFATVRPGEQLTDREYRPASDLAATLRAGYVYSGTCRRPRRRPEEPAPVDRGELIYSIQNHDFIGNHPLGKRFHQISSADTQRAAATLLLLSPAIPMLFMGEEFACDQSFLFFVDFQDRRLRRAVVRGRRAEYPQHDWSQGLRPIDPAAFAESRIGATEHGDQVMRRWYQDLIACRDRWRRAGLFRGPMALDSRPEIGEFRLRLSLPHDARNAGSHPVETLVVARLSAGGSDEQRITIDPPAVAELVLDSRPGETSPYELAPNHAKVFELRDLAHSE